MEKLKSELIIHLMKLEIENYKHANSYTLNDSRLQGKENEIKEYVQDINHDILLLESLIPE